MMDYIDEIKRIHPEQIEKRQFENIDQWPSLQRAEYRECQFERVHIRGDDLQELRFENCSFGEIRIDGGKLKRLIFDRCKILTLHWTAGEIGNVTWSQCELGSWTASSTTFKDLQMIDSRLDVAEFVDVAGQYCSFVQSEMGHLKLVRGNWRDLTVAGASMSSLETAGTSITYMLMGRSQVSLIKMTDCIAQTMTWFDCRLSTVELKQFRAQGLSWQDSLINGGYIEDCVAPTALLAKSQIRGLVTKACQMPNAILNGAQVSECDLRALQAKGISLRDATLRDVDLSGADLSGLNATGAVVSGLRLRGAICCDGVLHGQQEDDWSEADLDACEFDVDPRLDDSMWWRTTNPGPRDGALA